LGVADYPKADMILGEYLKYNVNTAKFLANLNMNVPYYYTLQPMAKNTSNGDFGIAFYGDKVVFASARNKESELFNWNNKPYLDLYVAKVNDKGLLTEVKPFQKI